MVDCAWRKGVMLLKVQDLNNEKETLRWCNTVARVDTTVFEAGSELVGLKLLVGGVTMSQES